MDNTINSEYIIDLYNKDKISNCKICNCLLELSNISIDSINPIFGHVKNNVQLTCLKCNIFKNTRFVGKYSEKPYFYDIKKLKKDKIMEILEYHNLDKNGIISTLRLRLEKFIKNLD